jgi:hypothetical protein
MDDVGQVISTRHGSDDHVAAVAAVTTVRPAPRHVLLPPEAAAAPSPIAAFDVQGHSIDKHGLVSIPT